MLLLEEDTQGAFFVACAHARLSRLTASSVEALCAAFGCEWVVWTDDLVQACATGCGVTGASSGSSAAASDVARDSRRDTRGVPDLRHLPQVKGKSWGRIFFVVGDCATESGCEVSSSKKREGERSKGAFVFLSKYPDTLIYDRRQISKNRDCGTTERERERETFERERERERDSRERVFFKPFFENPKNSPPLGHAGELCGVSRGFVRGSTAWCSSLAASSRVSQLRQAVVARPAKARAASFADRSGVAGTSQGLKFEETQSVLLSPHIS